MPNWENVLWWSMLTTAIGGGVLSMVAYYFPRENPARRKTGERMYIASYVLMSISMVLFAVRGFLT
jgi:hypothetical protein